MSDEQRLHSEEQGWQPITPEHYALYQDIQERARTLFDDEREEVVAVANDAFRLADEALTLWGTIDVFRTGAEQLQSREFATGSLRDFVKDWEKAGRSRFRLDELRRYLTGEE